MQEQIEAETVSNEGKVVRLLDQSKYNPGPKFVEAVHKMVFGADLSVEDQRFAYYFALRALSKAIEYLNSGEAKTQNLGKLISSFEEVEVLQSVQQQIGSEIEVSAELVSTPETSSSPRHSLAYWRRVKGYSQRKLAASSGVAQATIATTEVLKTTPTISTLQKLADVLEIPLSHLSIDPVPLKKTK